MIMKLRNLPYAPQWEREERKKYETIGLRKDWGGRGSDVRVDELFSTVST
jgi:hypothetical protein